jgi:hypothetical protein
VRSDRRERQPSDLRVGEAPERLRATKASGCEVEWVGIGRRGNLFPWLPPEAGGAAGGRYRGWRNLPVGGNARLVRARASRRARSPFASHATTPLCRYSNTSGNGRPGRGHGAVQVKVKSAGLMTGGQRGERGQGENRSVCVCV